MQRQEGGVDMATASFLMKMSTDFTARTIVRCSKACITTSKSAVPTESEKTCMQHCFTRHMALFGEGLKKMTEMMSQSSGPQ